MEDDKTLDGSDREDDEKKRLKRERRRNGEKRERARERRERRERREERLMKPNGFLVGTSAVLLRVWSRMRRGQSGLWAGQAVRERY